MNSKEGRAHIIYSLSLSLITYLISFSLPQFRSSHLTIPVHFNSKKLSQPGLFPLKLQDDELDWKISLNYEASSDKMILYINDEPFLDMPFQADVTPKGPMNILSGSIRLNGKEIHRGWSQWNDDIALGWLAELENQPTTDISIEKFKSTSSEVVNSIFDFLGRTIDREQGLKSLAIEYYNDKNKLEDWSLEQLAHNTHNL